MSADLSRGSQKTVEHLQISERKINCQSRILDPEKMSFKNEANDFRWIQMMNTVRR